VVIWSGARWSTRQAASQTIGDPETFFHLPQRQNATVRRQQPPSNLATTALPSTGDKPASGDIGSVMAGAGFLKSRAPARDE
jgi:hypothetical protein